VKFSKSFDNEILCVDAFWREKTLCRHAEKPSQTIQTYSLTSVWNQQTVFSYIRFMPFHETRTSKKAGIMKFPESKTWDHEMICFMKRGKVAKKCGFFYENSLFGHIVPISWNAPFHV
jgi:hypothetical protein